MKKSCPYCGMIHDENTVCIHKPSREKQQTKAVRIRSSYQWTKTSQRVRKRDHYLCRICLEHGRITYHDLQVHHIIPLVEDEDHAFDDEWLITLCEGHHEEAEKGKINRKYLYYLANHEIESIPPPIRGVTG